MTTYMFSESAGLMCEIQPSGSYYVTNGAWTGIRRGDEFDILRNEQIINTITVTDWKEQSTAKWPDGSL